MHAETGCVSFIEVGRGTTGNKCLHRIFRKFLVGRNTLSAEAYEALCGVFMICQNRKKINDIQPATALVAQ